MSTDGYTRSPKTIPGAFIRLTEDIIGIFPEVVAFQFNPESINRKIDPWAPTEVDEADRGAQAPQAQPRAVGQSLSFTIEFHAADGMETGNPLAIGFGVLPQIAALEKLTQPTEGLLGDLVASAQALTGNAGGVTRRPTVPVTLMSLGAGLLYPVRITSISVDQKMFNPLFYPIHASVALEVTVLTPDVFKCQSSPGIDIGIAAYNFTKTQENALALANIANSALELTGPLPL